MNLCVCVCASLRVSLCVCVYLGLVDRGGWHEEILPVPEVSDLSSAPFLLPHQGEGGMILGN